MDGLALRCATTKATSAARLALCVRRSGALGLSPLASRAYLMFFAHLLSDFIYAGHCTCTNVFVRSDSRYNRTVIVANLCTQVCDMLTTMLRRAKRKKYFVVYTTGYYWCSLSKIFSLHETISTKPITNVTYPTGSESSFLPHTEVRASERKRLNLVH